MLKKIKVLLRRDLKAVKYGVIIPAYSQRWGEMTEDASRFYINVDEGESSTLVIVTDDVKAIDILMRF
jgi:hypothetical protein